MSKVSQCRQNYHEECEAAVNKQINMELFAAYSYQAMSAHFDRDDVALPHFSEFFRKLAEEQREHADEWVKYQNRRGGRVKLQAIEVPTKTEFTSALDAVETALALEKAVNQALLDLHALADKHGDPQMCDFIEDPFLEEQVKSIKQLGDYATNLRINGPGVGEYLFERLSLS